MGALTHSVALVAEGTVNLTALGGEDYHIFTSNSPDNNFAGHRKTGGGAVITPRTFNAGVNGLDTEVKVRALTATDSTGGTVSSALQSRRVSFGAAGEIGYEVVLPAGAGERSAKIYFRQFRNNTTTDGFYRIESSNGSFATVDVSMSVPIGGENSYELDLTYTADSESTVTVRLYHSSGENVRAVHYHGAWVSLPAVTNTLFDTITGSYTLSGQPATTVRRYKSETVTGAYTLAGLSAKTGRVMDIQTVTGSYAMANNNVSLYMDSIIATVTGAYALNGSNATTDIVREMAVTSGAYTINGNSAGLTSESYIFALTGAYNITTFDAEVRATRLMNVEVGNYSYSGVNPDVSRTFNGFNLAVTSGVYAISGMVATVNLDIPPPTYESVFIQMRRKGRR